MVCLGFEPGAAGWKSQTNPLSYGGTPCTLFFDGTVMKNSFAYGTKRSSLTKHQKLSPYENLVTA